MPKFKPRRIRVIGAAMLVAGFAVQAHRLLGAVDYQGEIVPILTKFCAGCHNDQDREGDLSVHSLSDLFAGGESGAAIVAGDSGGSRLIQALTGDAEPSMPPEGEARPDDAQIHLIRRWIDEGALEDDHGFRLNVPKIHPSSTPKPITALAFSRNGQRMAVGRFQSVDLMTAERQLIFRLDGHPGKVNAIDFSPDGHQLFVATGISGLMGETWIWDLERREWVRKLGRHSDIVYAVACSPDQRRLATSGYDRLIRVWEVATGKLQRTLTGHNGPVFDLAFAPDSRVLASASADSTVKIWNVESGVRLDTLSQPLNEQYSVDISSDGRYVVAGGADNRLRIWRLVSIHEPKINPLLFARYAHEQAVQCVRFSDDGLHLASVSSDQSTKIWDARTLTQLRVQSQQGDIAETLAWQPGTRQVLVGRMDGGIETLQIPIVQRSRPAGSNKTSQESASYVASIETELNDVGEVEPNDDYQNRPRIRVPARIKGRIYHRESDSADVDVFRFQANRGDTWMIEVRAARDGSPLDSVVRVLDANGEPVPRMLLRAVRDSYFTFRGKDSVETDDFRLHNWEEMELNQYLYAAGEVVKLSQYPRGPDSGFKVFPDSGERHGFFETTPVTHALLEPCYIVEPHPPGTVVPPNGLPVFPIFYVNDDESQRRWGTDSLVTFHVPADGEYLVVLEDVRRFQGEAFTYQLSIRRPAPGFRAKMTSPVIEVPQGSGRGFSVELERIDGFEGPVEIEIVDLPDWLELGGPVVVEPGQMRAWGTLYTRGDRSAPLTPENGMARVFASGRVGSETVRQEVGQWGPLSIRKPSTISVQMIGNSDPTAGGVPVLEIRAGTTTTADVRIQRYGEEGPVKFGNEDAVVNAPHGVFVDNIGLNGVLITPDAAERTVFVKAESWVTPMERFVYVQADVDGSPASRPVLLRVLPPAPPETLQTRR